MTSLNDRLQQPDMVGLPDWRAAEILTSPDPDLPARQIDVATADAREILLATGEWALVVLAAEDETRPEAVRSACIILRDTITGTTTIRATDPAIRAATETLLTALVAAGVLTEGTKDRLLSLTNRQASWAEHTGVEVTARTVGLARGGI
jgi:hypothetical protein